MLLLIESCDIDASMSERAFRSIGLDHYRIVDSASQAVDELFGEPHRPQPELIMVSIDELQTTTLGLLAKLRANPETRHVPIVSLTNSLNPEVAREAYRSGSSEVVVKPVDFDEYLSVVGDACGRWLEVDNHQ